jgi:hypothetical protein
VIVVKATHIPLDICPSSIRTLLMEVDMIEYRTNKSADLVKNAFTLYIVISETVKDRKIWAEKNW